MNDNIQRNTKLEEKKKKELKFRGLTANIQIFLRFCHHLLTLMLFHTCMTYVLQRSIKDDILRNVAVLFNTMPQNKVVISYNNWHFILYRTFHHTFHFLLISHFDITLDGHVTQNTSKIRDNNQPGPPESVYVLSRFIRHNFLLIRACIWRAFKHALH